MTNKNEILDRIEDLLGSEGSREVAARLLPILEREGVVTFDGQQGYTMEQVSERRWLELLDEATT